MKKNYLPLFLAATAFAGAPVLPRLVWAQEASPAVTAPLPSDAEMGEAAPAVKSLRDVSPKTLVFVFDVSGSMRGELLRRAREATITLIREGTQPGDRLVLYTFGAGYDTVFDKTLLTEADKRGLIALVPSKPGDGAGTNIRKPHHEALKLLEKGLPEPGAVVLLTDSFNDEPKRDDPAYPTYLSYYTPGGRLAKFPDSPENRDYERLLRLMTDSQKVQIFGIGVQIDKSGRPVERLPVAEATPAPATNTDSPASIPIATVGGDAKKGGLPTEWLVGLGALALAAFAALLFFLRGSKPVPLRIKGSPTGAHDFEIGSGQTVRLGGVAAHTFDAYALPGFDAPVATLRGTGGRFLVSPAVQEGSTAPVNVSLNGLPLDRESPLNFGDEVRVFAPGTNGAIKEYRLIFDDPTKSF